MHSDKEPNDESYRQQILRARAMSGAEKMLEGLRLFERECRDMADAVRREYAGADERRVQEILAERLELRRREEEGLAYTDGCFIVWAKS